MELEQDPTGVQQRNNFRYGWTSIRTFIWTLSGHSLEIRLDKHWLDGRDGPGARGRMGAVESTKFGEDEQTLRHTLFHATRAAVSCHAKTYRRTSEDSTAAKARPNVRLGGKPDAENAGSGTCFGSRVQRIGSGREKLY